MLHLEDRDVVLSKDNIALIRFQKMYHNVREAREQLDKAKQENLNSERKKLLKEACKNYTQAYMAIVNPNDDNEYMAFVSDDQVSLAKLRGARKLWLDYVLQYRFNEVLSATQRQALVTEVMSTLDELDNDLFDQRELELRERIVAARRNISTISPENSDELISLSNNGFFGISIENPDLLNNIKALNLRRDLNWYKGNKLDINPNLPGAGGNRQMGRFSLMDKSDQFMENVISTINEAMIGLPNPNINISKFPATAGDLVSYCEINSLTNKNHWKPL